MDESIAIIIPTRNRFPKLKRCLLNLEEVEYPEKEIIIICDDDLKSYNKLQFILTDNYECYLTRRLEFVGALRYGIAAMTSEFFVYYNDDMVMDKDCLSVAMREFKEKFNGGLGLVQFDDGINLFIGAVGLTTKETVKGFDAFSPDYIHFYSDTELGLRTRNNSCFFWSHDAKVEHLHPITKKAILDQTYIDSAKNLEHDRKVFVRRYGNYSHQSRDAIEHGL